MPPQDSATRSSRLSIGSQSSSSSGTEQQAASREDQPQSTPAAPLGTSQKAQHQKVHSKHHMVGHGRSHPRPQSYGKNLNKLAKVGADHGGDAPTSGSRHHFRSHSHTPSSSPRPSYSKRAGSNVSLPRNGSQISLKKNQSQASLKKNQSNVSLKRNDTKPELRQKAPPRADPVVRRALTQPKNTSVRFDLGASEGNPDDSGWTEASSATESPSITRPSTSSRNPTPALRASPARSPRMPDSPPASLPRDIPHLGPRPPRREGTGHMRSTPPSADAITTRLLQRSSSRTAAPMMSTFSASATPGNRSPRSYASTLNTMETGSLSPDSNQSADRPPTASRPISTSKPPVYNPVNGTAPLSTSLPQTTNPTRLYRTQQKIMLQRASTAIEPHIGPHNLSTRSALPAAIVNDGRDMLRVWERAGAEYGVVRHWRSPIQEAVKRNVKSRVGIAAPLRQFDDERRMGLSQSLKEGGFAARRELLGSAGSSKDDSDLVGREIEHEEDEADDMSTDTILRRMWDRADIPIDRE